MNVILSAAKLVQLVVLAFAGWLLLQSLLMSIQTFLVLVLPPASVASLKLIPSANETADLVWPAWKEPFHYEAKVYINNKSYDSSRPETFFQNATEVWHVEPQSLVNRYPFFEKHLTLNLADTDDKFICVFIQKAGQFTPYPNISDPQLRVSKNQFAYTRWDTTCDEENLKGAGSRRRCTSQLGLMVYTRAIWDIHLEDNVYTYDDSRNHNRRSTTVHGPLLKSNSTTGSTGSMNMYLPSIAQSNGPKLSYKVFPITKDEGTEKGYKEFSASVDIYMTIRGVSTSSRFNPGPIPKTGNYKVLAILTTNWGRPFIPHFNYSSPTVKSAVSTAIFLALYPALLSLWLLRQLYIARLYFTSACSSSKRASPILRMYLFIEHLWSPLVDKFVFGTDNTGLYSAVLGGYTGWWFIRFILVALPQRQVASVIRCLAGSQATNKSTGNRGSTLLLPTMEKQKYEETEETAETAETRETEETGENEAVIACFKALPLGLKVFPLVIAVPSVVDYARNTSSHFDFAVPELVEGK
ncbi:hypothetical protein DL89DRAFT_286020 [Linderina pennispora]|uniref:Uncharacterized protein n=1 Tax=Linderina pennispora TaxID=61395 RepID=A0A1Y1VZW5_9FUNG|nr:uncharacterized protein DL89DRAFT_286020 [Linderina pennispora]ORX66793.1 hypothetical protein DL89DRAFT_286020 [Linderina pennispora]